MTRLIDIVNFNADASCFDSQKWLSCLSGGVDSVFCNWLSLYIRHSKKIVLGLTGATISDLVTHNPESVELIRKHPDIFQMILRPYSHDISLLRNFDGFCFNLAAGISVLKAIFGLESPYYLPAEFMMTNEQLSILADHGIRSTFVNASRYDNELASRIPEHCYTVKGILGSSLGCIPVQGVLTQSYLRCIQLWESREWNETVSAGNHDLYLWRDGESSFLLPRGIERENFWLNNCSAQRVHLGQEEYAEHIQSNLFQSYPVHSFSAWMKEFRMMGYIGRIMDTEKILRRLPPVAKYLWLLAINSDILSSVEKRSPIIQLKLSSADEQTQKYRILRSERGWEGEEFLALLDRCMIDGEIPVEFTTPRLAHHIKARGRIDHLASLEPIWKNAMP